MYIVHLSTKANCAAPMLNEGRASMLLTHTVSLSLGARRRLDPGKSCLHKARHSSSALDGSVSSMDMY